VAIVPPFFYWRKIVDYPEQEFDAMGIPIDDHQYTFKDLDEDIQQGEIKRRKQTESEGE
jgi:hypothetical protein